MRDRCKIIAEIGQNHNGKLETAIELVDAVAPYVDVIKLIKRDPRAYPESWKHKPYNNLHSYGNTYYDHRLALELEDEEFVALVDHIRRNTECEIGSSFVDHYGYDFIVNECGIRWLKIPSSRLMDIDLLEHVATHWPDDAKLILSSGMSDVNLVETVLHTFHTFNIPTYLLMQCTASYPTAYHELNLDVITSYIHDFSFYAKNFGLSTHCREWNWGAYAYALGAKYIEHHVTLDVSGRGRDHSVSLTPAQLYVLRYHLDCVTAALGESTKAVLESETDSISRLRSDLESGAVSG